jgi:hypothetical protein
MKIAAEKKHTPTEQIFDAFCAEVRDYLLSYERLSLTPALSRGETEKCTPMDCNDGDCSGSSSQSMIDPTLSGLPNIVYGHPRVAPKVFVATLG